MASLLAELYTYHVTRVIATRVCARERITLSAMVYSSSSILGWWCKAGKGWSLTSVVSSSSSSCCLQQQVIALASSNLCVWVSDKDSRGLLLVGSCM